MVNLPLSWGHLMYGLVEVLDLLQVCYFDISSSECLSCSDCLVVNGRLTSRTGPEQTTTQTPVKLPSKPPVRDGIGVSLAFCAIY